MKQTRQKRLGQETPYSPLSLPSPAHWIVYTDLDGTLLNHETYAFEAVFPVLDRLKLLGVPVVLNSSKTLAELEVWQNLLGLEEMPIVAENGGVIRLGGIKTIFWLGNRMNRFVLFYVCVVNSIIGNLKGLVIGPLQN